MLIIMMGIAASLAVPGAQAMEAIKAGFAIRSAPGYTDAIENGKPTGPVFAWGLGVLISAFNAAAEEDEEWRPSLRKLVEASRKYWNNAGPVAGYDVLPMPKQTDRYYDDNAWLALAFVETFNVLKNPKYLRWAQSALKYTLSGEDERLGGGICWRESDKTTKNTCSNAPAIAACLAVYDKTSDPKLLKTAERLYAWTKKHLQDPVDLLFWDNIRPDGQVEKTKWSYNTALMIRSAAELGRLTKETRFTQEAEAMAAASEHRWYVNHRIADEARFAHLLLESWKYVPSKGRFEKALTALRWLHEHARSKNGLFGKRFDRPPAIGQNRFELIDQASAARAFILFHRVKYSK